ncbi:neurogenic locus protein delta-like [Haliotis cracherodii]|uniref:neurogenic locus protein delta-like n=1 Tax=Haliotis cracherodii TaxID=6455 RepID=UPI0039E8007A
MKTGYNALGIHRSRARTGQDLYEDNAFQVLCSGVVEVKFKSFENREGKRFDGSLCDSSSWGWFTSDEGGDPCDHMFVICMGNITDCQCELNDVVNVDVIVAVKVSLNDVVKVDVIVVKLSRSSDMTACEFGRKETGSTAGNKIYFNGNIGETPNPMTFHFNHWPGIVKVKLDVLDDDDNNYDFVDHYEYQYRTRSLGREIDAPVKDLLLTGTRTSIDLQLKVFCDTHYYGEECLKYCKPADDETGHYICDPHTGDKICRTGWTGDLCLNNVDDCDGHRCYPGAICVDGINMYTCQCPPGRTGDQSLFLLSAI